MKIVQINATCGSGSTGRICEAISRLLTENNIENYVFYCIGNSGYELGRNYSSSHEIKAATLSSRIMGNWGFEGRTATKRLIRELEKIKPDIIHLHNLHSHACDLELLFAYIKREHIRCFWTFHDCWAFTGYCMHYDMIGCERWQTGCEDCPQRRSFSWLRDRSSELWVRKRNILDGVDLTIITPSQWLADQVGKSFLKKKTVKVINNGIDLESFRPTESDFREKNGLLGKKIVLGVSFGWGYEKGLDVFNDLASRLPDDYRVVLVGTDAKIDKVLAPSVISIHRTQSKRELAEIYSSADVFVNASRQETFPTVNIEALACGTPVVTFRSGGSTEIISSSVGGSVERNDTDALEEEIVRICTQKPYAREECVSRASVYKQNICFQNYLKQYFCT